MVQFFGHILNSNSVLVATVQSPNILHKPYSNFATFTTLNNVEMFEYIHV
jgi:hypothetical protein